jgi:creatinine amidohydrolase/Fe(II)-dependent formamide hydrolase-like protein
MRLPIWALGFWLCCASAAAAPSIYIEDLTWPEVRDAIAAGATTAIAYAGSTEQNGPHMATGKHNIVARHVAGEIAARLGNALVYPVLPFAPTGDAAARGGHMRFPGSVSVSDSTYAAVARDVALSARAAGFRHIVLMGDHGGGQQALGVVAADLDKQWAPLTRVHYVPEVYTVPDRRVREYLAARGLPAGDHAGLHDTAELMFLDKEARWIRRDRMQPGSAANGVDGDPRLATAELGRIFIGYKVEAGVEGIRRAIAAAR